ncbi:MAG TPA: TadE family protein [Gemmatimonadaceae bacterium]|jgi:Flp pilus assembly pilin Flp|nr:TadE family protein [Gemmatimonadaceae bacterium]
MRSRKFIRNEEGAAVVEFALVMPILALIIFGIIDFGRAFYTVNNIISAVREGARYGAILSAPMSTTGQREIRDRVRSVSQPFGGDSLRDDQIQIEFPNGELVRVRVESYPFRPLTPIAGALGVGTWPITRQATFRWERGT